MLGIFVVQILEDFAGDFPEENKSGDKIREKFRRLKNKNSRKIRSDPKQSQKESQSIAIFLLSRIARMFGWELEEDKRATTNVQNGLIFFFWLS